MNKDQEYREAVARSWVAADIFSVVDQLRPMSRRGVVGQMLVKDVSVATYNATLREAKKRLAQEAVDAENVVKELALANVK
jgi:hypothetical protein